MRTLSAVRRLCALAVLAAALASPSALAGPKKKAKPAPAPAQAAAPSPKKEPEPDPGEGGRRGPARIEFDDRLVQGQTNKANAIYLFERRESAMRTLLKKRTNFHDQIDEMLEDELMR